MPDDRSTEAQTTETHGGIAEIIELLNALLEEFKRLNQSLESPSISHSSFHGGATLGMIKEGLPEVVRREIERQQGLKSK